MDGRSMVGTWRTFSTAPRIELHPFRYRDPRTGKWNRARYVATREEIEARYAEWEIVGAAEIRQVDPEARDFTPHKPPTDAGLRRSSERPPELESAIDAAEAFLLAGSFGATSPITPGAAGWRR